MVTEVGTKTIDMTQNWDYSWKEIVEQHTPKRLLVDLDGCVVEYNFPLLVKKFFGVDISKMQIYAYDLADVLGVTPALIDKMFQRQVFGKPNFIDGALETFQ